MKSNAVCFITSGIIACCLCLYAEAAGAKTNVVEKTVAVVSDVKTDAAAKAAAEAKSAAEKGGAEAQFRYAEMLRDGRGVAKNIREAVAWTRKAADGGLAAAQGHAGAKEMLKELGVDISTSQENLQELKQAERATFINNA